MSGFSKRDRVLMARALRLARRGRYAAPPNPVVGCVLARDGVVIGEGWHEQFGAAHAEANALANAGDANGATAYVTLEPCAHHGKTPPCAAALIDAGVRELVCAMQDPFPAVSGRGLSRLADTGVIVRTGLMRSEAEALNRGYLNRVQRGRPFVQIKMAASLDGAVAMLNGQSQWISGPEARADVQRLRARSGAIMTGIGTVLADDPSFNVRDESINMRGRQPLRVVLDSTLRMPMSASMLCLPGTTLIYCVDDSRRESLENAGAEVVKIESTGADVDINAVLDDLGARAVNDVLVEAGPTLAGRLIAAEVADELVIYQAPHIMGSETNTMFRTPAWTELTNRKTLEFTDVRRVGADTRITGRLRANDE